MRLVSRDLTELALIILALLFPSQLAAQRPVVGVEVQLKAPDLYRNLYGKVPQTQQDIADYFIEIAGEEFGFIEWEKREKDSSELAARLTMFITDEELEGRMSTRTSLEFEAKRLKAGTRFDCSSTGGQPEEQPFASLLGLKQTIFSPQESPQPAELVDRVKDILFKGIVKNADFRADLSRLFLRDIPVCHGVNYDVDGTFTLAVGREDLRADELSLMQLTLCVEPPRSGDGGKLCLEAAPETLGGSQLRARFGKCEPPPRTWICRFGTLHDEVCQQKTPLMFKNRIKDSTRVFMLDYHPRTTGATGKVSTDPKKAGGGGGGGGRPGHRGTNGKAGTDPKKG